MQPPEKLLCVCGEGVLLSLYHLLLRLKEEKSGTKAECARRSAPCRAERLTAPARFVVADFLLQSIMVLQSCSSPSSRRSGFVNRSALM